MKAQLETRFSTIPVGGIHDSQANAYLKKPSTLDGLLSAAQDITDCWVRTATLPPH
jgi:hypothetical protein